MTRESKYGVDASWRREQAAKKAAKTRAKNRKRGTLLDAIDRELVELQKVDPVMANEFELALHEQELLFGLNGLERFLIELQLFRSSR